jgi:hypothetical protein
VDSLLPSAIVVNPPERKLKKRTSVQCEVWKKSQNIHLLKIYFPVLTWCIYIVIFSITARHLPFRVGVDFDNHERASIVTAVMTTLLEQQGSPGGITGFKLTYFQVGC